MLGKCLKHLNNATNKRDLILKLSYITINFNGEQKKEEKEIIFTVFWQEYMSTDIAAKFVDINNYPVIIKGKWMKINNIDSVELNKDSTKLWFYSKKGDTKVLPFH